jgi:hypothetical protein
MGSTLDLLRRLVEQRVDFVLVGGMAATAHGSSVVTEDVDVCTRFQLENLERLLKALEGPTGLSAEVGAICEAIQTHLRLKFLYGGKRRLVEPYCHGTSTTGAEVLRAVQVGSRSKRSSPGVGKLWLVAEMSDLTLAEPFSPSDPNYKPNDRAMKIVHCRI